MTKIRDLKKKKRNEQESQYAQIYYFIKEKEVV